MSSALPAIPIARPASPEGISQWISTQTELVLQNALAQPITALTEALMPVVTLGLTLQFMAYAFALMQGHGNMTVTEFFKKSLTVALVASIATSGGLYQSEIALTLLNLPEALTQVVTGDSSISTLVDLLQKETAQATHSMGNAAGSGWFDMVPTRQQMLMALLTLSITLSAAIVGGLFAVVSVVIKVGMALIVGTGPLFIVFVLFDSTRRMFDSWVSQALNFVFLQLLAGLIFALLLQMNLQFVRSMAHWLKAGDASLMSLLAGQLLVAIASLVTLALLPGLAAALSSGFGARFGIGAAAQSVYLGLRLRHLLKLGSPRKA